MSTPTPSQKIQQYVDSQQFETAYQILVEEQKKLFEAEANEEEFRKRGKELIEAFLALTYPIDRLTLDTKLQLKCCQRAKEIHERGWNKPDDLLIKIYNYTGYVINAMRITDQAIACHEYIISICDEYSTNPDKDKMEAYHGIAFAYEDEEEFEMALRYLKQSQLYFDKMMAIAPDPTAFSTQKGGLHNAFGSLYAKMNRYDDAIEHLHKAMAVIEKSQRHYFYPIFNLARNLYHKKDYHKSVNVFEKIEKKYQDSPDLLSRFSAGLADSYLAIGDREKAEKTLLKGAKIFENTDKWHPYIPPIFSRLADFYQQKNDYTKADFYIEKALKNCKSLTAHFRTLFVQGKIQFTQNQYLEVLEVTQKTDDIIDQIRLNHKTQASRLLLAEQAKDLYECGIEAAFLLYKKTKDKAYVKTAFRYAEKSKAILLLMEIKHQDGMLSAGMPPDVLQQEKEILRQLNYLDKMLNGERKLPEVAEKRFKEERFELQREHEVFLQKLEQDYPDYYQQKYNTEPASIEDLQNKLSDNRLIINYFVGKENVYIFRIGKEHADVEKVGGSVAICQQVMDFRKLLEKPIIKAQSFEKQALTLYDILLKSILEYSKADQLLIVPDDALTQLPFEALVTQKTNNDMIFSDLNYMINDYEIVYHFSATLWHYGLKKYERQQRNLSFVGFAPMYGGEVQPEQVANGQYRTVVFRDVLCHELPFAKREVKQAGDFFEQEKKIFIDVEATKESFLKHCMKGTYLHIAAHSFYSKDENEDCYIQFSPSEKDDIKLTIKDIASLKIDAHLVVLSCCNTGQGQFRRGESVFALNRSFMAAGGQNVISTLFKVPDALACELMTYMYEVHLSQQKDISPALRDAKRQLIMREGVTPMVWCGYQLMGS